jgi:hypothetical protein
MAGVRGQVRKTPAANPAEPDEISKEFENTARELLDRPAPPPRLLSAEPNTDDVGRSDTFFDPQTPPPDNAPLADLIDYWQHALTLDSAIRPRPTDAVRERLLTASEADPQILDEFLPFLPEGKDTADRVVRIYQTVADDENVPAAWRAQVGNWLKFNSTFFLNDLIADSRQVKDKPGGVQNEAALDALAKLDPQSAKPILLALVQPGQIRVSTLATAWLLRIAVADYDDENQAKYVRRLRAIAVDRSLPAKARDAAIDGLLNVEWDGRDSWYRNQFANPDLVDLSEGTAVFSPLLAPLMQDPDRWIPVLSELVQYGDRDERSNAGNCLVRFVNANPRREAILPLLPWLKDRRVLRIDPAARTAFIYRLGQVDVPEAAEGLAWVVYLERENRRAAAFALKRHPSPLAIGPLRSALRALREEEDRPMILDALIACGGLSNDEQFGAVKAFARKLTTPEGREAANAKPEPGKPGLSETEALGKFLAPRSEISDAVATAVLEEAETLRQTDRALSDALLEVARNWQVASVDLDLFRRIRNGTAGADMIVDTLKRRGRLTPAGVNALQYLIGAGGFASAVAALLSSDETQADHILGGTKSEPKIALLACARLTQARLPIGEVGELLKSRVELVAFAAEQYLLVEDSAEARAQLWRRYPLQAYVTGWRENSRPDRTGDFPFMDIIEHDFQNEVLAAGAPADNVPREVYALFDKERRPSRILRVYRDRAVYVRNETVARYRERTITVNELAAFRKFVAARGLTVTGPQFALCGKDCQNVGFLAMNRGGARRTLIRAAAPDLASLFNQFDLLGVNARTRYRFENTFPGVEVLIDDPTQEVVDVWQAGSDLRVRIERPKNLDQSEQEVAEKYIAALESGSSGSVEGRTLRFRLNQISRGRRAWYNLREGKLIPNAGRPAAILSGDESDLDLDLSDFDLKLNSRIGLATAGTRTVLAVEASPAWGLWEKRGTLRPQLITGAAPYRDPVVSPQGDWAVATRVFASSVRTFAGTDQLVRVNLATEEAFPVDLPLSDRIDAIAYLPSRGKFLVRVARAVQTPEETVVSAFYLVEPITGLVEPVRGDFEPLMYLSNRMLQPTSNPGEYWAAIPDLGSLRTEVGRYDVKNFTFHPIMTIPYVAFDSQSMWVDEPNGKLLIAYDGQLVRMPLGPPVKPATGK